MSVIVRLKTQKLAKFKWSGIQISITAILVFLAWIFFRAESVSDAFYIVTNLYFNPGVLTSPQMVWQELSTLGLLPSDFILIMITTFILFTGDLLQTKSFSIRWTQAASWSTAYVLIFSILVFGVFEKQQFIYFQFWWSCKDF